MTRRLTLSISSLSLVVFPLALACTAPPEEIERSEMAARSAHLVGPCAQYTWNRDDDLDDIDDGHEECALLWNAPILHFTEERHNPTSVEWYIRHTNLRFDHGGGCDDCAIKDHPLTQADLTGFKHKKKSLPKNLGTCGHIERWVQTDDDHADSDNRFFLWVIDEKHWAGPSDPMDWRTYGHVYKNDVGGVNAQYWFLYPYSSNVGFDNHEGDWEMVTVRRNSQGMIHDVIMCGHGNCRSYTESQLQVSDRARPHVWVASGTHANYSSPEECAREEKPLRYNTPDRDPRHAVPRCSHDNLVWYTFPKANGTVPGVRAGGIVNMGERRRPLNGQTFILAEHLRWGQIGNFAATTAPTGPTDGDKWWKGGIPWPVDTGGGGGSSGGGDPQNPQTPEDCPGGTLEGLQCACTQEQKSYCSSRGFWITDYPTCSCTRD
jgi:hypothetical protein